MTNPYSATSAQISFTTTQGHPVPTHWVYRADRPLEVSLRVLVPGGGWRTWIISRDALADTFDQWSVTYGMTRIAVLGQVITLVLTLDRNRWLIAVGESEQVHDFIQTTFDLCPPCSGCADEACPSCVAVRRQIDTALTQLIVRDVP